MTQSLNRSFVGVFSILAIAAIATACAKPDATPSRPIANASSDVVSGDGTSSWNGFVEGRALDENGRPASGVSIVVDGAESLTGTDGTFKIRVIDDNQKVLIRKPGYQKVVLNPRLSTVDVQLKPLVIRGVYVQTNSVRSNDKTMQNILRLIESTELNALVIDVKDDDGRVHHDLAPHVAKLKALGVYLIARIVTFKDNTITRSHPELAIMKANGEPWEDKHGVRYLSPLNPKAHEYVVSVAREAMKMGFDEVQFDYVRFPTDGNLGAISWSQPIDWKTRSAAIASLLKRARSEIGALGGFVAADVFGITAHEPRDSGIGQHLETITPFLDYVCPMVYPAGYAQGTSGIASPSDSPGAIVGDSVRRYRVRAPKTVVVRPWLQAFKDYNKYSGRFYGAEEIRAQIDASNKAGADGFLLWNAGGRYSNAGLNAKNAGPALKERP